MRDVTHIRANMHGNGGEPPMELSERVAVIERDVATIKTDVAIIRSNYVTKEDLHREIAGLHKEINAQTWKLITFVTGFGATLTAVVYFIAKHVG